MEPLSAKRSRRDRRNMMRKSSRVSSNMMKPQIWKFFPEDLFKDVLARLPFTTIIRFRTVCHQWNNLITSPSFSQYRAQVSESNPWFYLTFADVVSYNGTIPKKKYNYKAVYDPFTKRWYYSNAFEILTLPVSSVGGLVCSFDSFHQNMYVCNPLTKSFEKLLAGSIKRWSHLGMTMNGTGGYRVLRFSCDREYEIYDSATKNWGHLEKLPKYIAKPKAISSKPVSIDDTLYYLMHIRSDSRIVSCNTSTGVWTQHLIQPPFRSSDLALAESEGRIMLAGLLTENDATFVCIWEVQKVTFLLKEVDRMPCPEFHRRSVNLICLGNKGLLFCYLRTYNIHRMVTYNMATRKWAKVCLPPYGRKMPEEESIYGIAFQPCLTAMP